MIYNGNSYTSKTTSLYWDRPLAISIHNAYLMLQISWNIITLVQTFSRFEIHDKAKWPDFFRGRTIYLL